MIGRRAMISVGLAFAPFVARAQPSRLPTIGFLGAATRSTQSAWVAAFMEALREHGWTEGRNVAIVYRWMDGQVELADALAAELVGAGVDIIVTATSPSVRAVQRATSTIPIVFASSGDPVGTGLIASLIRPGGNATGLSFQSSDTAQKRVELLREAVPGLRRLAILANLGNAAFALETAEIETLARTSGIEFATFGVRRTEEIAPTIAALRGRTDGLYVFFDAFAAANRSLIAVSAMDAKLPSISVFREFAQAGGLMSYGPSNADLYRRAAGYVDKILRGARPGDLPVEQPTTFDLTINVRTARALGLEASPALLARADEVIE
jgi:putative tryptophan/tyrosine transport system substrate-binding protein